jgi:peptide/nickel transport system ATP-binding protein/oligopeptide transport system ATP-binding protein
MPLLSVRNLRTWFPVYGGVMRRRTGEIKAVDDVSFDIEAGRTVGLVGESGSGKTTVGRTLLKLTPATSGQVLYEGRDILPLGESEFRPMRKDLQMIFQDPFGSLNPRMTVGAILAEPLEIHFPPKFIVCDEPVSALDVSVQAQIVNLLQDLQEQLGIAYLFIAHDLAVVEHVSDHVIVMHRGKIVESAPAGQIYENPQHEYTKKLLSAVPKMAA